MSPAASSLAIRDMRADDLAEVERIEGSQLHPWTRALLQGELERPFGHALVAIDAERRVHAFLFACVVHDGLEIVNVATDPAQRRQGAARALLEAIEARARTLGATQATLEVRRSNAPAIGLYAGLGYTQVGVRRGYYQPGGEDALVMNKSLEP